MSYNYIPVQTLSGITSITDGIASITNVNLYSSNIVNDNSINTLTLNTSL